MKAEDSRLHAGRLPESDMAVCDGHHIPRLASGQGQKPEGTGSNAHSRWDVLIFARSGFALGRVKL
jgi:hypothetical protein